MYLLRKLDLNGQASDLSTSIDESSKDESSTGLSKRGEKLFVSLSLFTTITTTEYEVNLSTTVAVSINCISKYEGTPLRC